jgi:hypothetical protein
MATMSFAGLRDQGWLLWSEVEQRVGPWEGNLRRQARGWLAGGFLPLNIPRPVNLARGRGSDTLYPPQIVPFLHDVLRLQWYAKRPRGTHRPPKAAQPHGALRLLMAGRGWPYAADVIRGDILGAVEQFHGVLRVPLTSAALGGWLFLGEHRTRKQVSYGAPAFRDLMLWWGVLADTALDREVWDGARSLSWESVVGAVRKSNESVLRGWLVAARPLASVLCEDPPSSALDDILKKWIAHERAWRKVLQEHPPKGIELVRRREVATRMFHILNRHLDDAFQTRPEDVPRWQAVLEHDPSKKATRVRQQIKEEFERAQQTNNPFAYMNRWVWYDGQLYHDGRCVYEVPADDPARHRPQSMGDVLARYFRYLGVFLALGIATAIDGKPVAPLPDSFSLPITCRLCQVHVHTETASRDLLDCSDEEGNDKIAARGGDAGIAFWCPSCYQKWNESVMYVRLIEEKARAKA